MSNLLEFKLFTENYSVWTLRQKGTNAVTAICFIFLFFCSVYLFLIFLY